MREWRWPLTIVLAAAMIAGGACGVAWILRPTPVPIPTPSAVDGFALGTDFAPTLPATYADAWDVAADRLESGGTLSDSQADLQAAWKSAREQSFLERVAPGFSRVLPAPGTEPTTQAQRTAIVTLFRDFAAGLRGKRR